jgi:hypothetical protein
VNTDVAKSSEMERGFIVVGRGANCDEREATGEEVEVVDILELVRKETFDTACLRDW